jgi:hypothetical protein
MYNKKDSEQVGMTDQGKLMRNYNVAANFSLRRMNAGARPGDPTSRKACGYYTLIAIISKHSSIKPDIIMLSTTRNLKIYF